MLITSPSNPKIKEIVKLREGKYRRRTGLFLIDGLREIRRAIQCGIRIQAVFGTADDEASLQLQTADDRQRTVAEAVMNGSPSAASFPFVEVSTAVLEKMTFGERNTLVAVAETPETTLKQFVLPSAVHPPLIAVLETIEKPGNIGAVFRSADGAGLDGIILADPLCDLWNPAVIRNSMGTVFRLPAALARVSETIAWLREHHMGIAVARCEAAIPYTVYDFRQPTAIVLGNEADGLTEHWQGTAISLPMLGIADSLNVANAAAVLFYEARRQRSVP
jgi:TrmH family RNA methyltransferase